MELSLAEILLPDCTFLIGKHSVSFDKKVKDVFIGFEDGLLTRDMRWIEKTIKNFQNLPTDAGRYTLCVEMEGGEIRSLRSLIEGDKVAELAPISKSLSYMFPHPDDIVPKQDAAV